MTTDFDKLIMGLERELEEQKSIRRRTSLTLRTITRGITVASTLYRDENGFFWITKAGLAIITFADDIPQIFMTSFASQSGRENRGIATLTPWNIDQGQGVVVVPTTSATSIGGWDEDMAYGSSKNISVPVYITSTGDFTLTASQIDWENPQ